MPNRQRTTQRFYTAAGARVPAVPAPMSTQATAPAPTAPGPSRAGELGRTIADDTEQHPAGSAASQSAATATLAQDRCHHIADVPAPWGVAPQQNALRGVVICHDSDGRCSYAASHKCPSAANHWSRCIVIDFPDVAVQWEDTTEQYTATRERTSLVDLTR